MLTGYRVFGQELYRLGVVEECYEDNELNEIESYPYVHHLVSTIVGRCRDDVTQMDALAKLSPGGSITGCPKIRCCDILSQIEPYHRGPYTGSIGYISIHQKAAFNIAIRTCYRHQGSIQTHSGCGITIESDPHKEWDESIAKLGFLKRRTLCKSF